MVRCRINIGIAIGSSMFICLPTGVGSFAGQTYITTVPAPRILMAPRPVAPNFDPPVIIYRQLPQTYYQQPPASAQPNVFLNNQSALPRPAGIPDSWTASPTTYTSGNPSGGVIYQSPQGNASVRYMPQNASNPNPYYKQQVGNQYYDNYGNPVDVNSPAAHIPPEEYNFNPELFIGE